MATAAPPKATSLAAKLVAIMDEVGPIEKTGWNSFHRYKYLKEEDIINAVRPLLTKHGVAIIPNVLEEHVSDRTTAKGATELLCRLKVEFTFVDIESQQQISVVTSGHGADAGDKAAYKAMTGALKYALRQVFMISEGGEDAEADEVGDARRAQAYPENDATQVVISASNVPGAGRGGRNTYPNKIQIDQLREQARAAGLSVVGLAALIETINGDSVDVSDVATAGMNLQAYLTGGPAERVTALTRAILEMQRASVGMEPTQLFPEESANDNVPFDNGD